MTRRFRWRFAPSPTGALHFGSLIAAVGSYCEALSRGGDWLVRMEDLDRPRETPGAVDDILRALEACGFEWQRPVMFQSRRTGAYRAAFERLKSAGAVFPCACSRREIADSIQHFGHARRSGSPRESTGQPELVYPGTCRDGLPSGRTARAFRLRVGDAVIAFEDPVQGSFREDLTTQVGDFVVLRADSLFAYQLAVVVDDGEQGVTDVVRGADLLDSTPRQIYLQQLLELPTPRYLHVPAAVNAAGQKLSKQTLAAAIDAQQPLPALLKALRFLGHQTPGELAHADTDALWQWAIANWNVARIPRQRAVSALG